MNRYSNLYGTIYRGNENVAIYASVGGSEKLPTFLNEIGATNAPLTVETVRSVLGGFPTSEAFKSNYAGQPKNDLPVSVRYAPMHLRNHPQMPSTIKPFTVLSITGSENKTDEGDTRFSTYVQTIYIGREHMHEATTVNGVTYNYLDQIFGSLTPHKPMGYQQVAMIRSGRDKTNIYDALPRKVEPKLQLWDRNVVYNAVDAVFDNKTVVIRLEKGCAFNARAWEVLIPIYALMPPRLATEIGFATYLEPGEIPNLVNNTSIRIFVLPAECELPAMADAVVMDLNGEPVRGLAPKEVGEVLNEWNKLAWEKRQPAMEKLFADTAATYNDKNLFVQRSNEFAEVFAAWRKREWFEKEACASLEQLKAKYDALPELAKLIPWMKAEFVGRVPAMMTEKGAIHKLTGEALAMWRIGKDAAAKEMYEFGKEMGGTNLLAMADTSGALARKQALDEAAPTLAKAIADGKAAVAAEQAKTQKAIADGEARLTAAEERAAQELAEERARAEAAAVQAKADADAALAAEQEKTEQVKKVAAEKIKTERDAHEATKQTLADEQTAHQATQQNLADAQAQLSAEQTAHQATQGQLTESNGRLEKAKTAYVQLKKECDEYKGQIDGAKAAANQAIQDAKRREAEAAQAKADLDAAKADLDQAKAKADKTIQENNKRMIIFAAAGFLVAALIFGIILLVMGLSGGKDVEETSVPTVETTLPIETTEATEATTEATEAPTEVTEPQVVQPDLTDWSDNEAALWLTEQIKGIREIVMEDLPEELSVAEGYSAVAKVLMNDEAESYAVLLQASVSAGDMTQVEMVPMETQPAETEETTGETEAAEETGLEAVQVEGARVVLTSESFVLVVYGGDDAVATAIEMFSAMMAEDAEVVTSWNLGNAAYDLDALMSGVLGNDQWWRTVAKVSTQESALAEGQTMLATEKAPVLCLSCDGKLVFLFEEMMSFQAKDLAEALTEAGHSAATEGALVAVLVGE